MRATPTIPAARPFRTPSIISTCFRPIHSRPSGVIYNPSINESNVSPEATLTCHPQSDVTLYAAYKTGYLAGAIGNPANVSNYTALANPNDKFIYKAEKVKGFELGAKGLLLDERVSADADGLPL